MSNEIAAKCRKAAVAEVTTTVGFCFSLAGVIAACLLCLFSKAPISVERPALLVLAALLILAPFKSQAAVLLQRIAAFYLFAVVVNESASHYIHIPLVSDGVSVSYTAVVVLLCAAGYLPGRLNSNRTAITDGKSDILWGWALVLGIIILHIAVLAVLLNRFYGYGYERDLSVLGGLCLYVLLFIFVWDKLGSLRFRQAVGLVLVLFYCAMILSGG
ncbi:MAG TPA: hypothetical protein VMX13_15460 [Sedimentisphaerales bacterium]|nr:hypothetical protein [Sedimentisphaerales bacterium]